MDDAFAFHPPGLSPSRFNLPHPSQQPPGHDPFRPGSSSGSSPGTATGAGPAASGAFAATLPPVQEQPGAAAAAAAGVDAGGRPTLVGFDELTGEDLNAPGSSHGFGGAGGAVPAFGAGEGGAGGLANGFSAAGGAGAAGVGGGGVFARPLSPTSAAAATSSAYGGGANSSSSSSTHAFFNPQTVHPSVNSRNTRPMTAPSGAFYNAYSAAPSGFYAPAPSQLHGAATTTTTYDGMQLSHAPGTAGSSSFQYAVDSGAGAGDAYDSYRARGFSLPDVNGIGGGLDPPSSAGGLEDSSPTGTTPFFYTPPAVQSHHHPQHAGQPVYARPVTAAAAYPTVLDHAAPPGMVHPLLPAPGLTAGTAILPPGATLLDPHSSRPSSSGGPPSLNASRRSSGGGGGSKSLNFVPQAGQATKRPRRRYDEIERLYGCDYPGCTKAYGTLNHLNSHKTMQKHGPKSTPAQFKEMRKAWRERKKAEAAASARARAAAGPPSGLDALPTPGLPSAFTIPSALERPRPSTSAGEYHLALAAPTTYMAAAPPPPAGVASGYSAVGSQSYAAQPAANGTFIDAQGATWTASFPGVGAAAAAAAAADPYGASAANAALRPMTAPSYYMAPAFGAAGQHQHHPHQQHQQHAHHQQQHQQQQQHGSLYGYAPRVSGAPGGPMPTLGAAASADRRYSLPSTTLAPPPPPLLHTASAPAGGPPNVGLGASPEMKMPQPVLGYQPEGHAALIGGGPDGAGGGGARRTSGSGDVATLAQLGLATGGGGAAKLVLGGGGGEGEGAYGGADGGPYGDEQ
ncbi:hypothetical protein JCM6882_006072 [Rhodosporidiobolus microsporus]